VSVWTTLVAIGVVVVVLGALLARVHRSLAPRREPRGLGGFLRHFDPADVSEEVVIAVYRQIERWEANTAPRPEHDLRTIYGLLPEEIHHAVAQVARACDRLPGDVGAVRTVGDWVRHVSEQPRLPSQSPTRT
jgi:hypothetical protein